ncbi:MAG: hypothetical protein MI861_16240, partial [Pirellulales bacterium]|nr:hypothetical protein [Pirellulales bacterium]
QVRFVVSDQSAAILEEALVFYDQFAQQNANSPKLQRHTAKAYRRAGDLLERLGRYTDAEQAYRRSAETLRRQINRPNQDAELVAEAAAVSNRLALVLHHTNRSEEAKVELEQAKAMLSSELARREQSLACLHELALTHSNLGLVLWRMHQGEESSQRHRRAILLLEGLSEENPLEAKYRIALARAYRNYYPIAAVCKQRIYSDEIRSSAERILEQLVQDFPSVPDYRCELSEMLTMTAQSSDADPLQQLRQIDRAVQLAGYLNRQFRSIPRYQTALGKALTVQASLLRRSDPQRASEIHHRACDLLRQLSQRFPDVVGYQAITAHALREQGVTLAKLGRVDESICVLEEAVSEQSVYLESRPKSLFGRQAMCEHLQALATTLENSGDSQRAAEMRAHADSFWKRRPTIE